MRSIRHGMPLALILALVLTNVAHAAAERDDRPNILFILVDDMGVNDLGFNGSKEVKTPNLDRLAGEGVYFSSHYMDSTCTASRVGILTGQYPARLGFRPANRGISPQVETLGDMLSSAGYSTHHIGKWHVGYTSRLAWPLAQGFDSFFGFLNQSFLQGPHTGSTLVPKRPTYLNPWLYEGDTGPVQHKGHLSRLLADKAVEFIQARRSSTQPWYLNFWTYAPHSPLEPMPDFARRYADDDLGRYLAMLEQVDHSIGRVLKALAEADMDENTLVIVASDNGGTEKQRPSNYPYRGVKTTLLEGGVRTPLLMRWPGRLAPGTRVGVRVSYLDYLPTLAAVAGVATPDKLPGQIMPPFSSTSGGAEKPLYWEASVPGAATWALLSADNRWRLTRYFTFEPELLDLQADPRGHTDTLARHPATAAALQRQYQAWRLGARQVALDYRPLSDNGRAMLAGDDLQRAPGYGGHSFGIGITPAPGKGNEQVIAMQRGLWSLLRVGDKLRLRLGDASLEADMPPNDACAAIVVSSYLEQSPIYLSRRKTMVDLFVNGKPAARFLAPGAEVPPDDFLPPTYIGQDELGRRTFAGKLGKPVVINEQLLPADEANPDLRNGVTELNDVLCAGASIAALSP